MLKSGFGVEPANACYVAEDYVSISIEDIKKGSKILINGIPYNIDEVEFMKPGKGRAIYRLKLRNYQDGSTVDRTYHSGEKVDEVNVTTQEMQYLYKQDHHFVFMNIKSFEQCFIDESILDNKQSFLKDGTIVNIVLMGEKPLDVNLPNFVELKVVESAIGSKSDTVTNQAKTVVLETGLSIGVPTFVKEGDMLKIDTRSGTYVERISTKK